LDLTVVTPFGTTLAVSSPSDPLSGGVFAQQGNLSFGPHVESIHFPMTDGPSGTYTFYVGIIDQVGTPDRWTVTVYVDEVPVKNETGMGNSNFMVLDYSGGVTLPPMAVDTAQSAPSGNWNWTRPVTALQCQMDQEECCSDSDCTAPHSLCVQRICIEEGNPRFTLTWNGNDDYTFMVTPPIGNVVSYNHPVDYESGGIFEGEGGGSATVSVLHAENIYFPLDGGPLGTYTIQVEPRQIVGIPDPWTVRVYVDGQQVDSFTGVGASNESSLTYDYHTGGQDTPQQTGDYTQKAQRPHQ
jgi:hypothetical protein